MPCKGKRSCAGCTRCDELGGVEDILGQLVTLAAPIVGGAVGGPAGAAIGSGLGGMLGSAISGGGAPSQKQVAQAIAPALDAAGIPLSMPANMVTRADLEGVVRQIVSSVPSPVMDQVRNVISQVQAEKGNVAEANRAIVQNVSNEFLPQVQAMIGALRLAQDQTVATQEHRAIVTDDARWTAQQTRQEAILRKLDALEARLTGASVVRGSAANVLGGAGVLGKAR